MQPPNFGVPAAKPAPKWKRTPPAIFAPIFGLFGLGLAWLRATDAFMIQDAPARMIFGATTLLFLFFFASYMMKVAARIGVWVEDLKILPGRAGLSAMSLSGMLMAVGLYPMSATLSATVLIIAIGLHTVTFALTAYLLITGPTEARAVTPVWHLTFVGFVISPLAALPLGWTTWSLIAFWGSFAAALAIWAASALQFARRDVPAPLRPLLAVHLAPASVIGVVALLLGYKTLGLALGLFAILLLAALVIRARWVTEAGFTPLWGAFTFPLAAFSSLMQMLGSAGMGEGFRVLGGLALVAATMMIPVIMWKVIQLWVKGQLAVKTNAAEA